MTSLEFADQHFYLLEFSKLVLAMFRNSANALLCAQDTIKLNKTASHRDAPCIKIKLKFLEFLVLNFFFGYQFLK